MIVGPVAAVDLIGASPGARAVEAPQANGVSFAQMLRDGVDATSDKLVEADRLVKAFALDDSVPAHQVMFAIEEARLSLEMMIQVRNRLVEGYQQIMNMQV